jgi:hypothetical protein
VSPVGHWQENVPPFAVHCEPGPQTVPQVPQLAFVLSATQAPLQTIWPAGQAWH